MFLRKKDCKAAFSELIEISYFPKDLTVTKKFVILTKRIISFWRKKCPRCAFEQTVRRQLLKKSDMNYYMYTFTTYYIGEGCYNIIVKSGLKSREKNITKKKELGWKLLAPKAKLNHWGNSYKNITYLICFAIFFSFLAKHIITEGGGGYNN